MKFKLERAAKMVALPDVEINTIEDLKKLSEERGGHPLIVYFKEPCPCCVSEDEPFEPQITIYDGYIE